MSGHTLLRQWALLRAIPRHAKVTAQVLTERLEQAGFKVTERTVQRDLQTLSRFFPLEADERNRPFGWRYAKDAHIMDIPAMDAATALTFKLANAFLEPVIPPSTLRMLKPHMERADEVLGEVEQPLRDWADKVRFVPRGQPLIPPDVSEDVLDVVYQSLLEEHRFKAVYKSRGSDTSSEYTVNPMGLVYRNGLIYLVCTLFDYTDIRQLVLHRMQSAQPLPKEPATVPVGFSLDNYIRQNNFEVPTGDTLRLEAMFGPEAAPHLYESKLSEDQELTPQDDGWTRLKATVADTLQLRWWLRGFGSQVEVLGPGPLREEFTADAALLVQHYQGVDA